ncbi:G6b protein [Rattus norvegicus]|uniref:Megakaryocyte and platelet inhibitory receptor G6b n=2 Tax=Rattus norvegicus TaxID=10116 RepID=G6B_RAT|nr:RecName: Full=Megakaryocyte and platelet inhibitory receptor G6b; AltName: Full=Protein G6b; Flags: Precursor [Rattus norvegicus]EDL83503.1 G6b protein [Rattus norvegicus]CAE83987.1 G6b protein [Rattus norvegicus]|eukprot:NP_001003976.1 megakaryocyte and platelet inhibitory receptor G6b precursor [Rattus norvegicus]
MALVLQLLPLLLSKVQGNPEVSLEGNPGDRVNLSCIGVSDPTRWAWAPSFPACKGLSKGRRPILWASSSGTPTVLQHFSGRLRSLDTGIKRLELLLSAGDSGTFFCKGRQENESRTVIQVLGDKAGCRPSGSTHGSEYSKVLIPLLGFGLVLGLGALGLVWWRRSCVPPSHIAPVINAEPQRPLEQDSKISGHLDQEPNLHYADLDHSVLRRHRRMSALVPGDASTVYAVVV